MEDCTWQPELISRNPCGVCFFAAKPQKNKPRKGQPPYGGFARKRMIRRERAVRAGAASHREERGDGRGALCGF